MKPSSNKTQNPYVVIVVLNYNNFEDTEQCILSLLEVQYPHFSIIIIDNASPDGSGKRLQERFSDIECILSERNDGYAAGNNIGIKRAIALGAEYILILNNDTIVQPQFLTEILNIFTNYDNVGIATCKILYERTRDIYVSAGRISRMLCAIVPLAKKDTERICEVNYIAGCAMLIKKEVFDAVGFFDESFFMYYEDVEFSLRVAKKFKLMYTPHGTIFHKSGGGDLWKNYTPFYFYYSSRNRIIVFGEKNLIVRLYAFFANLVNAGIKILYLIYHCTIIYDSDIWKKVSALLVGMVDGLRNRRGKK